MWGWMTVIKKETRHAASLQILLFDKSFGYPYIIFQ